MTVNQKILRLEKRHKGLSAVTASINNLYIYGVYESNFPVLMEKLNEAKDACKEELRDCHIEIVAETKAGMLTESHDGSVEIHDEEDDHAT
jgi:hypothetical protein|tara:strand:- start:180 stop:452 length:273 start_codon:yes stop_codon:yes gene_type:complete